MLARVVLLALLAIGVQAFAPARFGSSTVARSTTKQPLNMLSITEVASLLLSVADAKPDDYVYGAVAAPDFALPLGAVLIISIAGIPALLSGGEKALDQQRVDEETRGVKFGRKNKSDDV